MLTAYHAEFVFRTQGKGTYEITNQVAKLVNASQVRTGLANVFLRHTSASLLLFENADATARRDLERFFERLLGRSSVKDHRGSSPSSLRAASQNSQQRHYTSH